MSAIALPGCIEVDGGAVELSWSIRTPAGQPSNCTLGNPETDRRLSEVWICWTAEGQPTSECTDVTDTSGFRSFPCNDAHGVTKFEVDAGPTLIWIQPVCAGGRLPAAGTQVPAPILRDIVDGQVAALNALLIVAAEDACDPLTQ